MCNPATPQRRASPSPLLAMQSGVVHFCFAVLLSLSARSIPTCLAQCVQGTNFCTPPSVDITGLGAAQLAANSTIKTGDRYCEVNSGKVGCSIVADGQFSAANLASSTSAWQSDILTSANNVATVELRLPVNYILFSIKVSLSRIPARLQVETSQDDGVSWRTRFRYTTTTSDCDFLPLADKALCDRYRPGISSVIHLYDQAEFLTMLGNTSAVAAHLNSQGSSFANRVRLVFNEVNDNFVITEGGENRPLLLYYRAEQLEVRGTCWCNGHAQTCAPATGECDCAGNTVGQHCQACADGFYKRNVTGGFACQACNCDMTAGATRTTCSPLGMCQCRQGYSGQHCDACSSGYHRSAGQCLPCGCAVGAVGQECQDETGMCQCRPGATGVRCQHCHADHYGLDENGCRSCDCVTTGTAGGQTSCNMTSGQCLCAASIAGRRCNTCAEGYERMTSSGCTAVSTMASMATESSATSSGLPGATGSSETAERLASSSSAVMTDSGAQPVGGEGDSSGGSDLILVYAFIPATIAFATLVIVIVYVCKRSRRRHGSPDRESSLKRDDSCSSRLPLDAYAAHGPRSSPDEGRVGIGNRKMSMASLYDTADVVAPQLRVATPSAPGSKRQSFINEEAMSVTTTATLPTPLHDQLMPHLKESTNSLTAYDISKIINPPPEPYAESKFKITNVGPNADTGVDTQERSSPSPEEPTHPTQLQPYASAKMKLTPIPAKDAEPLSRPRCEYTLPDPNLKRQRRSVKRQKSGDPTTSTTSTTPTTSMSISAAPLSPTLHPAGFQVRLASSLASDV